MSQWSFVIAAYTVATLLTAILVVGAWRTMRRAEAAADALKLR